MKKLFLIVSLIFLGSSSLSVYAAKLCKGTAKSACSASKNCTWVSGYTAKTGKKVKAYCRNASGKGKTTSAANKKKKTTAKKPVKNAKKATKPKKVKAKATKPTKKTKKDKK